MTDEAGPLIGVLGGMGPAATADFYAKLVDVVGASRDQEHPPVVIWADPRVPDRVASVLDGTDAAFPVMLQGAKRLAAAGATFAVMPCNTAHHWVERLAEESGLPFLDMVGEAVAATAVEGRPVETAILATEGTIDSGLYQRRWRRSFGDSAPELTVPSLDAQRVITEVIARVKSGDLGSAGPLLQVVVDRARSQGADRIVLACTELPLAWGSRPDEPDVVDASAVLARATWREFRRQMAVAA